MPTAPPPTKRSRVTVDRRDGGRGGGAAGSRPQRAPRPAADDDGVTSESGDTPSASGASSSSSSGSENTSGTASDTSASSGGDGTDRPTVAIAFEFFDPRPATDYHAVRALLAAWLDGAAFDVSKLATAVVEQTRVGTLLKAGDDDQRGPSAPTTSTTKTNAADAPPIGFITVLNAGRADVKPVLKSLADVVASAPHVSPTDAAVARALLTSPTTGVLVSERVANAPPALAPALAAALFDEVAWATEDEPTQEERDAFKFTHYAVWSRAFVDVSGKKAGGGGKKEGGDNAAASDAPPSDHERPYLHGGLAAVPPPEAHARPEDGFLCAEADWAVVFPAAARAPRPGDPVPVRVLARVPAARVAAARAKLEAALGRVGGA